MNKILFISGPTATGKTDLAVKLAKKFNGELISADSRQIYKGMDIGTGKDQPTETPIHLINIINPNQSFSVAQYRKLALLKIKDIQSRGKLPIIVGGTGQYIDSLINPQPTFSIKPNKPLRYFLNKLPLSALQFIYQKIDTKNYFLLNNSDVCNPHRLIRKIEIATSRYFHPSLSREKQGVSFDFLHLCLTAPSNQSIYQKIDSRVEERLKNGLLNEISALLQKYSWNHPGLNTIAYKEFKPYFTNKKQSPLLNSCIEKWKFHEHALARRQKTWFKKRTGINFVDIVDKNYPEVVEKLVAKWYNHL